MFDLRRLGKVRTSYQFLVQGRFTPEESQVGELSMVGVNGSKFPAIRKHLDSKISQTYKDMDAS